MAEVPHINTNAWRLPKKTSSTLEDAVPDEAYRKLGLPLPENSGRTPSPSTSRFPTVDVSSWTLPKKEDRPQVLMENELGLITPGDILRNAQGHEYEIAGVVDNLVPQEIPAMQEAKAVGKGQQGILRILKREKGRWISLNDIPYREVPVEFGRLMKAASALAKKKLIDYENGKMRLKESFNPRDNLKPKGNATERFIQSRTAKPKRRSLRRKAESVGLLTPELRSEMRRLAGLERYEHVEFATGQPYRTMPEPLEEGTLIGKGRARKGMKIDGYVVTKASQTRVTLASTSRIDVGSRFAGETHTYPWDGTGYEKQSEYLHTDGVRGMMGKAPDPKASYPKGTVIRGGRYSVVIVGSPKHRQDYTTYPARKTKGKKVGMVVISAGRFGMKPDVSFDSDSLHDPQVVMGEDVDITPRESRLSPDIRRIAGITESINVPRPLTDARALRDPNERGVLDLETEGGGEAYIDTVLAESRWFFRDFGAPRPFVGEAPGGRAEPWSGSDDEPAKTPIIRKGKTHGTVGDQEPPEARGEVDVGKSEIDYDHDPGNDEEEKAKAKGKKKPPPPEEEERTEASRASAADRLRRRGGQLRRVGGLLRRRGTSKIKSALHKKLAAIARKHGIGKEGLAAKKADDESKPKKKVLGPKKKPA